MKKDDKNLNQANQLNAIEPLIIELRNQKVILETM